MTDLKKLKLILSTAPHIRATASVNLVMWLVVIALAPAAAFGVYINGIHALLVIVVCVLAAVLAELAIRFALKRPVTAHNGSAFITGLLLAFNLPPDTPLWIGAVGSIFAIIIVKELFGGLGFNIWNPALAARAFLMASWPTHMTTPWHRFAPGNILSGSVSAPAGMSQTTFDIITGATPLGALKEGAGKLAAAGMDATHLTDVLFSPAMLKSLALGDIGGCIGETSAVLLLVGALLLLVTGIITWHIPASYILSFSAVILPFYWLTGSPMPFHALAFHLLSGGLILGAFFMATDMVTSPVTPKGMLIYGAGCGIIAASIRLWGGYPEGVSYSILFMNTLVPLIDRYIKPRVYGRKKA